MTRKDHWESVYKTKGDADVSWTQADPRASLALIAQVSPSGGRIIDVGGGASSLAGRLIDADYTVAVLDLSAAALASGAARLGACAARVRWVQADVTEPALNLGTFDVWHDRAVFHFLTESADRAAYLALLKQTIPPSGHAVIATFALDGPEKCSGLDVRRYDPASLSAELGADFELQQSMPEIHVTPWGKPQSFQYSVLRRR